MFTGIRYDYGKVIELDDKFEPKEFKYKSNRQKCRDILHKGLCCICLLSGYGAVFALGYSYGSEVCDGSL